MSYDPISLISDKQCVIIDIGSKYTKFGFSGEVSPRCIVPTVVTSSDTGEIRRVFNYKDKDDFYVLLVDFIHMLFFRYALIHPKEKRIVLVESLLCPTDIRETLAAVFFNHFEVTSLIFVPSHMVTLYTLGIGTGLVLDIGQKEAVLIPVYEGVPVLYAWQALPLASDAVELNLHDLLTGKIKQVDHTGTKIIEDNSSILTDTVLEDIKVKGCFVTSLGRAKIIEGGEIPDPQPPGFTYRIGNNCMMDIEAADRELPYEVLFEQDGDHMSVSTMILDSILKCPLDMRKPLAENIVFIGGTTMAVGLKARIQQELMALVKTSRYADKFHISSFKFHKLPAKENYAAWLGGSILGATDTVLMKSLTREVYVEMNNKVPDWSSLIRTRLESQMSIQ